MNVAARARWYDRLSKRSEPVLLALTLVFVAVAFLRTEDGFSSELRDAFYVTEWVLWVVFAAEFALMLYLSPGRERYVRERWWELAIILVTLPYIPFGWLPAWAEYGWVARPLRFLRTARAARALRFARLAGVAARSTETVRSVLTRHGLQYLLVGAATLYVLSAALVWVLEQGESRPIQSFPSALWWGITTVTNLPNDGNVPVTTAGKGVAVFVSLLGLTLVGLITANIAAFLVRSEEAAEVVQLRRVAAQLSRIEEHLGITGDDGNDEETPPA